jgi:hypothetical protein
MQDEMLGERLIRGCGRADIKVQPGLNQSIEESLASILQHIVLTLSP